jgi:hypothetical protein
VDTWYESQSEEFDKPDDTDKWTEEDQGDIVFLGRTRKDEDEEESLAQRYKIR